jgi:hypothetical protein
MGIKELKLLKKDIVDQLKQRLEEVVSGPVISVSLNDALEVFTISMLIEQKTNESTGVSTENILIYDITKKDNIVFQGSSKTLLYKKDKIAGILNENIQVDLNSLYLLQQVIYNFCITLDLIENESNDTMAEVGVDNNTNNE